MDVIERGVLKTDTVCKHDGLTSNDQHVCGDLLIETCRTCFAFRCLGIWNAEHTTFTDKIGTWIRN